MNRNHERNDKTRDNKANKEGWQKELKQGTFTDTKEKRGRPPMGIEKMLRMYLLQIWFNLSDWERYIEHCKSSIRSKVEHAFRIIKCQFGYKKRLSRIKEKRKSLDS